MQLEFSLLSMTELRNHPGEILDRVADKREAFIVERSGRKKACLVPLSVFIPDIPPSRIANEIELLEEHGEQPRTTITDARELAFRFPHKLSDGKTTEIMIILPHGYPNSCPRIYVNGIRDMTPHRWTDGALCVFGVTSVWNPGKHTVWSTLKLAKQWLEHYSVWRGSGRWPSGGGPVSE